MKDYAPLFLYSFDHGHDEQYAPIGVLSFIAGSSLALPGPQVNVSNAVLQATPGTILNPIASASSPAGTISAMQPTLPAAVYVTPLPSSVQHGANWAEVMASQSPNLGLYGHVTLLNLENFQSDADPALPLRFRQRYGCTAGYPCASQIIKIEYWQFFGYSHDYQGHFDGDIDAYTDHSGDWCTVQLYIDASWWNSSEPSKAILAVYHYLHGIQIGFDMAEAPTPATTIKVPARSSNNSGATYSTAEFRGPNYGQGVIFSLKAKGIWLPLGGPNMNTEIAHAQNNVVRFAVEPSSIAGSPARPSFQHPVVYVEWGGHEFWPTPGWSFFGASKHNGTGQYSYFGSSPIDLTVQLAPGDLPNEATLVSKFAGYWGEQGGGGPPQGPPLHLQWYWDPQTTGKDLLQKIESTSTARTY